MATEEFSAYFAVNGSKATIWFKDLVATLQVYVVNTLRKKIYIDGRLWLINVKVAYG